MPAMGALHPDGSRIVLAFSHTGELVIARTSDGETLSLSRQGDWEVTIETGSRVTSSGMGVEFSYLNSPIGYMGVCATENAIYALWVGVPMSREDSTTVLGIDPREIHVYGWDGGLRTILRTDFPILQPHVAGDRLYTTWPEPIPEVRVWDLSGIPGL